MAARTATGVSTGRRTRKQKSPVVRWIKRIILLLLTIFCIGFVVGALVFASALKEAQTKITNLPSLMAKIQTDPTTFYSADGVPIYIISNEYRRPVDSQEIPLVVKNAVVAAEDVRFYKHHGVDIPSL